MTGPACACRSLDAVECVRWRYPGTPYEAALEEPCTCACHYEQDEEPDDWQDEDWTGHPDLDPDDDTADESLDG